MSRPTKQRIHLKKIRQIRNRAHSNDQYDLENEISLQNQEELQEEIDLQNEEDLHDEIDLQNEEVQCNFNSNEAKHSALEYAFATLASGESYTSSAKFNAHLNRPFTSKSSFYRAQQTVANEVERYAKESIEKAQSELPDNALLSGDGRYSIRRNSPHCTYDIIDSSSNKIVAFGVADKKSFFHPNETFSKSSNLLESEAMRRALSQINCKHKVSGFILDGDNKNPKLLQENNFNSFIFRDPNHLCLCFNRFLDAQLYEKKKMIEGISDCFRGIRDKVKKWYSFLIHSPLDVQTKRDAWANTVSHLVGNHQNCLYHKPTDYVWEVGLKYEECAETLYFILLQKIDDFYQVTYGGSTQSNEAFHKEQLSFCSKDVLYPRSQVTRDYMALLRHNEGPVYELELRKRLHLPNLDFNYQVQIENEQEEREGKKIMRRSLPYKKQFNSYRKKKSEMNKYTKGDYKPSEEEDE